jgi:hypothetical protein
VRPALAGEHGTNKAALASEAEKDLVKEISIGGGVVQDGSPTRLKTFHIKYDSFSIYA